MDIATFLIHLGLFLLALTGFLLARYIYIHKKTEKKLVCPLKSDCGAVIHSDYSKFLGLPVERVGMVYYIVMMLGHLAIIVFPSIGTPSYLFVLFLQSMIAFLFSLYLILIQAFALKKWCTWCLSSAFMCATIFAMSYSLLSVPLSDLFASHRTGFIILHMIAAVLGIGAATFTDIFFFRFMKDGRLMQNEVDTMKIFSQVIWVALGIFLFSGTALFLPKSEELLASPKFVTKMIAVFVLIVNGTLLHFVVTPHLSEIPFNDGGAAINRHALYLRKLSFALGGISFSTWYFVFILALVKPVTLPLSTLLLVYGGLLICVIIGSQIMERIFTKQLKIMHI